MVVGKRDRDTWLSDLANQTRHLCTTPAHIQGVGVFHFLKIFFIPLVAAALQDLGESRRVLTEGYHVVNAFLPPMLI